MIIWLNVLWSIWKVRSDRLPKIKVLVAEEVVDISKVTTWCWYLGKLAKSLCIFYANGVKDDIFPNTDYSVRKCVSRGSKPLK